MDEKIKSLPPLPGVYLMKVREGILYIGKAKNLKSRVRSYFRRSTGARRAIRYLLSKVEDVDTIVTSNEKEALLLEDTLLKKHKPCYNIRLKDDKACINIGITVKERFPRLIITRKAKGGGTRCFGPYASARMVRATVKFLRKIFPLCVCTPYEFRNRGRPCLDYQMNLCSAPAAGLIAEKDYRESVDGAIMFLEGRNRELVGKLKKKMFEASSSHRYEEAAKLRDQVLSIEATLEEQRVVLRAARDMDVFGLYGGDKGLAIEALFVRGGRLIGTRDFGFPACAAGLPSEEVMSSFLNQFYRRPESFIPDEVLLQIPIGDSPAIEDWLSERKGKRVLLGRPRRGEKAKLLLLAEKNAREAFKRIEVSGKAFPLEELKTRLRLFRLPKTIEAFDISNIGGKEAAASMVVFRDGIPDKSRYRLYRIKTIEGPDDYAMMYEALWRRFKKEGAEAPDLVVVDGGKGQLNVALSVLKGLGVKGVDCVALAKERFFKRGRESKGERVYVRGVKDPVILKEGSAGDLLLRRARDEAHRFAITYHKKLRKRIIGSVLDNVPGIGKKKRQMLFSRFKDLDGIKNASTEELTGIPGITEKTADAIRKTLCPEKSA
ncbi:MAG: excinuclease ABC subunit UvrC [Deltaproteobacteria bacterium]|nr:excinuclease ABC subunit UvrC [Deltaproteobacteria bacterium]